MYFVFDKSYVGVVFILLVLIVEIMGLFVDFVEREIFVVGVVSDIF